MVGGTSFSSRERVLSVTVVVLVSMLVVLLVAQIANDSSPEANPSNITVTETTLSTSSLPEEETFPITTDSESTTTVVAPPNDTEPSVPAPEKTTTTTAATTTTTQPPTRNVNLSISVKIVGATPAPGELSIAPSVDCFRQDHYEIRNDQVVRVARTNLYSTFGHTFDGADVAIGISEDFSFVLGARAQANCVLGLQILGGSDWYSTNIRDVRTRFNGKNGFPSSQMECLIPYVGNAYNLDQGDGPEYLPFASETGCSLEVELLG